MDKISKSYWNNVHSSSDQSNLGSDKTSIFHKLPYIKKH